MEVVFQNFLFSGVFLVRSLSRQEFVSSGVCLSGVCLFRSLSFRSLSFRSLSFRSLSRRLNKDSGLVNCILIVFFIEHLAWSIPKQQNCVLACKAMMEDVSKKSLAIFLNSFEKKFFQKSCHKKLLQGYPQRMTL